MTDTQSTEFEKEEIPKLSQTSYRETPYEPAQWELIGTLDENPTFEPLSVEVVSEFAVTTDPMFQDFGGIPTEKLAKRWHNANSANWEGEKKEAEEVPVIPTVTLTVEEFEAKLLEVRNAAIQEMEEKFKEEHSAYQAEIGTQIETVFQDLQNQLNLEYQECEKKSVQLAVDISNKIIAHGVEVNPEYIIPIIREALDLAGAATIHKVKVSPQDMEFLDVVGFAEKLKKSDSKWFFEADPTIKAGCIVDTSAGQIDYDLDKAWERVKDNVVKAVS